MGELTRIGVDTSKALFTVHGVDAADRAILRLDLRRSRLLAFFGKLAPVEVAMEACGSSHHWGRQLAALGHRVRLIPPQYIKPYVKRGKNDRVDAAAICEAAGRPDMRFVAMKSVTQQAEGLVAKLRETLVCQRPQLINTLRGHAAEFGLIAAKGTAHVGALLAAVAADPTLPEIAREMFALLGQQIAQADAQIAALEVRLQAMHKASNTSRRLATIPGIGPTTALALTLEIDPANFRSGRHLAAWLGLTPKDHSTAGKQRLGGITRAGNERLRALLVSGAMAVIRHANSPASKGATAWLRQLLHRRPRKLAAVALANKMARIAWALMTRGEDYHPAHRPAVAA
ncbi:MAG TPA: IS110 family transposase [Candidatus Sulfopaludibacter sp.]|nr:IS110 family transposase [Candidatus Sulfopaludibacter sp.]